MPRALRVPCDTGSAFFPEVIPYTELPDGVHPACDGGIAQSHRLLIVLTFHFKELAQRHAFRTRFCSSGFNLTDWSSPPRHLQFFKCHSKDHRNEWFYSIPYTKVSIMSSLTAILPLSLTSQIGDTHNHCENRDVLCRGWAGDDGDDLIVHRRQRKAMFCTSQLFG